jgi:hypothetical protein
MVTAKPIVHRRRVFRPFHGLLHFHALNLPELPKKQKPTVGFQARFFLERPDRWRLLRINGLQREKSRKSEKTRNKMSFCVPGPPVFLP